MLQCHRLKQSCVVMVEEVIVWKTVFWCAWVVLMHGYANVFTAYLATLAN